MNLPGLSATIIVKNEEPHIADCLASLDFVSEIIVLDSGSSDRTEEICRADPRVKFFQREWLGFGKQKNLAADLAGQPWILNLDADERVTDELKESLLQLSPGEVSGYRIARRNFFGDRWVRHCGWYPDQNLRLYRREECRFNERQVHEAVECPGPVGRLAGDMIHLTYRDWDDLDSRLRRYARLAASERLSQGRSASLVDLVLRPPLTFLKMLLLKRGLLEGRFGWRLAAAYAGYTYRKYAWARRPVIE